jgi:hypothetical protein
MGLNCSKPTEQVGEPPLSSNSRPDALIDPFMHSLEHRSIQYSMGVSPSKFGQLHLLHKHQRNQRSSSVESSSTSYMSNKQQQQAVHHPTRLVIRRRAVRSSEEGMSGAHIYAVRYPADQSLKKELVPPQQTSEQAPQRLVARSAEARPRPQPAAKSFSGGNQTLAQQQTKPKQAPSSSLVTPSLGKDDKKDVSLPPLDHLFAKETMLAPPKSKSKSLHDGLLRSSRLRHVPSSLCGRI